MLCSACGVWLWAKEIVGLGNPAKYHAKANSASLGGNLQEILSELPDRSGQRGCFQYCNGFRA
jgi:hypothetical protein